MIFTETELKNVYIIEPERLDDYRGFLLVHFAQENLIRMGLIRNSSNVIFLLT